jgi:hypothetical protein
MQYATVLSFHPLEWAHKENIALVLLMLSSTTALFIVISFCRAPLPQTWLDILTLMEFADSICDRCVRCNVCDKYNTCD